MKRLMLLLVVLVLVACGPDPYDQVDYKEKLIECLPWWQNEMNYGVVTYKGIEYYSSHGLKYNETDSVVYIPYSFSRFNPETEKQESFFNNKEMFIRVDMSTNFLGVPVQNATVLNDEQIEIMYKELCE